MSKSTDALAPFRPRWAPRVAWVLVAMVIASVAALFTFVRPNAATTLDAGDYGIVILFAGALVGVLWRQGTVSATPDPQGLSVRNLLTSSRVEWAQIVSVRFSPDRAWAQLDLADGSDLSVMAIQSADGARAKVEAARLAALVEHYSTPPTDA